MNRLLQKNIDQPIFWKALINLFFRNFKKYRKVDFLTKYQLFNLKKKVNFSIFKIFIDLKIIDQSIQVDSISEIRVQYRLHSLTQKMSLELEAISELSTPSKHTLFEKNIK